MIIIPTTTGSPLTSFAAQELGLGYPLNYPRIGWHSYTFDLTPGHVAVSSESADGPADAPLRPETLEFWEPLDIPATWTLTLGDLQSVDYVGIASHSVFSMGGSVLVETSEDGETYTEFSDSHTPTDNSPMLFLDESRSATHVRITITGGSPNIDVPRIAVIYVGTILKMQLGLASGTPLRLARDTVMKRKRGRLGHFLGQTIQRNGYAGSASFHGLTPEWYRENFDPFVASARRYPFFWAWNPLDYPTDLVFAWALDDIAPNFMGVDPFFEVSFQMAAIADG